LSFKPKAGPALPTPSFPPPDHSEWDFRSVKTKALLSNCSCDEIAGQVKSSQECLLVSITTSETKEEERGGRMLSKEMLGYEEAKG